MNRRKPRFYGIRSSRAFVCIVVSLAVFTDAYTYGKASMSWVDCLNILIRSDEKGLVIPILPFALRELANVLEQDLQRWTSILLAMYGAGAMIGAPVTAYWADRSVSRNIVFLSGLMILAASVVAFTIGHSITILMAARFIQGASAASVYSVGTVIIADAFADRGMGVVMGVLDMSMASGTVLGPAVGGLVYHYYGYRAVFLSAYLLIAIDLALRILMSDQKHENDVEQQGHDHHSGAKNPPHTENLQIGIIDETTSLGSSHKTYGAIMRDPSSVTSGALSASASVTSATVVVGPLSEGSLPPRRSSMIELLLIPRMQVCLLGDFMENALLTGLESVLPLRIKIIFGYNSKEVALILLMLAIPLFGGPLVGHLADKYGPKRLVVFGFVSLLPLLVSLRIITQPGFEHLVLLRVLLLMIGTCFNAILTPLFLDVTYLVDERADKSSQCGLKPKKEYAQAYALMSVACASGCLCGPLLGGLEDYIGWSSLTLSAGLVCALCAIPSFLFLGKEID